MFFSLIGSSSPSKKHNGRTWPLLWLAEECCSSLFITVSLMHRALAWKPETYFPSLRDAGNVSTPVFAVTVLFSLPIPWCARLRSDADLWACWHILISFSPSAEAGTPGTLTAHCSMRQSRWFRTTPCALRWATAAQLRQQRGGARLRARLWVTCVQRS